MKLTRSVVRTTSLGCATLVRQILWGAAGIAVVLALAYEVPIWMEDTTGTSNAEYARTFARKLAFEAYPHWRLHHPDQVCPHRLRDLLPYGDLHEVTDPWGADYVMYCGEPGIIIQSLGEDGRADTLDDIWSRP